MLSIAGLLALGLWRAREAADQRRAVPEVWRDVSVEPASLRQAPRINLEGGVGWLNTAGPIHLEELRGKIVLLDFWTYCCINCHHVLPDLAALEKKYKNELVVIGVHTAKFEAERETENIRKKVHEYGIKHPVVNDANQVIWNRFGVNSWPTLVLIDAKGEYLGSLSGEGHYEVLDRVIGELVKKHRAKDELSTAEIRFFPESEKTHTGPLLFPGKVLADAKGKRLFVSDTGHNRIVMTDLEGKNATTIGSGTPELADGAYDKAAFNRPQGMCVVGDILYVADTENHAIRAVDLKAKRVTTVAGDGKQSHRRVGSGPGKTTGLNSPWDVLLIPGTDQLAIAMAGPHQIWKYDISSGEVSVWAGSGHENILDGSLTVARFAQPSGLATDGKSLFVADSEVSAVRAILPVKDVPLVQTIVGVGLFDFGDIDGQGSQVRLQHCLGLAFGGGKLYIADSYNNKIKVCDPKTRSVKTFLGTSQPGTTDNPPRFDEPAGLSLAGTTLYVADTNNHKVRMVDVNSRAVKTLELEGLKPPTPRRRPPSFSNAVVTNAPAVKVAPGDSVKFEVALNLPPGYKVTDQAPMPYLIEAPGEEAVLSRDVVATVRNVDPPAEKFSVDVPLAKSASKGEAVNLKLSVQAFGCNEGSSLCKVFNFVYNVPVTFEEGGLTAVPLGSKAP
jgi:thiol-disulfide isomerase/thioredoxin